MARYLITEVRGDRTPKTSGYASRGNEPNIGVVVTDTYDAHRRIAEYSSEDKSTGRGRGKRLGVEGARQAAAELAARLEC